MRKGRCGHWVSVPASSRVPFLVPSVPSSPALLSGAQWPLCHVRPQHLLLPEQNPPQAHQSHNLKQKGFFLKHKLCQCRSFSDRTQTSFFNHSELTSQWDCPVVGWPGDGTCAGSSIAVCLLWVSLRTRGRGWPLCFPARFLFAGRRGCLISVMGKAAAFGCLWKRLLWRWP